MPRLEEPKRRTRIRSTYRPTRRQREIAAEHGITAERLDNLFAAFTHSHQATRSYAVDWDAMWRDYVAKSVAIDARMNRRTTAQPDPSYIDPRL
jgi:hypothetical protein